MIQLVKTHLLVLLFIIFCYPFLHQPWVIAAELTHGPVFGAVGKEYALVLIRTDAAASVQVRYDDDKDLTTPLYSDSYTTCEEDDYLIKIPLLALQAATRYYVNILVDGEPWLEDSFPSFKTFPEKNSEGVFKLLYLTDFAVRSNLTEEADTFVSAAREKADFCFIGGDFTHDRTVTLQQKTDTYKTMYDPDTVGCFTFVKKILHQMPITHQYDDWDFGPNNSDKTSSCKEAAIGAFKRCVPHYPLARPDQGIWHRFNVGKMAEFFVLDCRSQRDPDDEPDGTDKSMLDGDNLQEEGQRYWLFSGLQNSNATWKIIFSTVVFNEYTKFKDGWMAFATERQQIIDFVNRHAIRNVVVVSADLHSGGIDDGTNSGLPEMVVPGADIEACCSGKSTGQWSEGTYGKKGGPPCKGYGLMTFDRDADTLKMEVKNAQGNTMVYFSLHARSY